MADKGKGAKEECSFMAHGCHKYLVGGVVGALLTVAGFGFYHMGKCARMCPMKAQTGAQASPQK